MFLKSICALINKEIKEENEPKETAVLIRVLCLIDLLFLGINAALLFACGETSASIQAAVFLVLMVGTLCVSYRTKMNVLVYLYYGALALNIITVVVLMGLSFTFQAQFYIIFMVFFYRAAGNERERIMSVLVSCVILTVLVFYIRKNGTVIEDITVIRSLFSDLMSTLYIVSKSTAIAYFFRKKFSASEEKIIRYSKRLEMLATTDPLTKLQNRRGMLNHIEDYAATMLEKHGLLTVAIGDIDFFKKINDTYGHDAGDYVLETLAKIMNEFMDGKGMVARWGGEEFLFSLENINGDYAFEEMSKLLHLIEKYEFSFEGTPIKVTMTFGLEEYDDHIGIDKVITKADEKLYMGKEQGRNRVIY